MILTTTRKEIFVFSVDCSQVYSCLSWVAYNYSSNEISRESYACDREAM